MGDCRDEYGKVAFVDATLSEALGEKAENAHPFVGVAWFTHGRRHLNALLDDADRALGWNVIGLPSPVSAGRGAPLGDATS